MVTLKEYTYKIKSGLLWILQAQNQIHLKEVVDLAATMLFQLHNLAQFF